MKNTKKILIAFLAFLLFTLPACNIYPSGKPTLWRPTEGVWYCDELQIQFSYDREYETYAIVDGTKIICVGQNDLGSSYFYIVCQERACKKCELGTVIFGGKYAELTDSIYVLKDVHTKELYTFLRIH